MVLEVALEVVTVEVPSVVAVLDDGEAVDIEDTVREVVATSGFSLPILCPVSSVNHTDI